MTVAPTGGSDVLAPIVSPPCVCIWCLREQGLPAGTGSHSICTPHKNAVLATYREKKNRKQTYDNDPDHSQ